MRQASIFEKYKNEKVILKTQDGCTVSVFEPNLFRVIPQNSGNLETERGVKLRFLYRLLIGYRIYLMRRDDEFIAYVMFQKGRIARYPFVEKGMLLMGPYFVNEKHRGHAYAKKLLEIALEHIGKYRAVFAWIVSDNEPSRRTVSNVGFSRVGWLNTSGVKKAVTQTPTKHELWKKELTD